jgi:hypothetical protein
MVRNYTFNSSVFTKWVGENIFKRFVGNNFFWNGLPTDLPDSIYNGTICLKAKFTGISEKNSWVTTTDKFFITNKLVVN